MEDLDIKIKVSSMEEADMEEMSWLTRVPADDQNFVSHAETANLPTLKKALEIMEAEAKKGAKHKGRMKKVKRQIRILEKLAKKFEHSTTSHDNHDPEPGIEGPEQDDKGEVQTIMGTDENGDYKQITVEHSEEVVTYHIYSVEGFFMRVRSTTFNDWMERAEGMPEILDSAGHRKYSDKAIESWKWSKIYNTIRADQNTTSTPEQLIDFAATMYSVVFEGETLPEKVELVSEEKEYLIWNTYRFKFRVPTESYEKFLKKMKEKLEKNRNDPTVPERRKLYIQKGMKLTAKSVTGSEFYGNFRELYEAILTQEPPV